MPARVTEQELYDALDDALTLAEEFQGATLDMKLAAFGLDSGEVRAMLAERAETCVRPGQGPQITFTQGFTEGMIATVALLRRARARADS